LLHFEDTRRCSNILSDFLNKKSFCTFASLLFCTIAISAIPTIFIAHHNL
jgi:hypothetical protein